MSINWKAFIKEPVSKEQDYLLMRVPRDPDKPEQPAREISILVRQKGDTVDNSEWFIGIFNPEECVLLNTSNEEQFTTEELQDYEWEYLHKLKS